jgi:hypothetical protein
MNDKMTRLPKFNSEGEEADWWASAAGRAYVKARSAEARARGPRQEDPTWLQS